MMGLTSSCWRRYVYLISYSNDETHVPSQLEYPFDLMQIVTLATIKLSILFFYRRIFRGRAFNIASWVLIGVVAAWAITFFIAILAACGTSIAANFQTLGALKRECVNTFDILIALAVSDVAVDLGILIMPIPLVSRLFCWRQLSIDVVRSLRSRCRCGERWPYWVFYWWAQCQCNALEDLAHVH